jgi:hypothetical protein
MRIGEQEFTFHFAGLGKGVPFSFRAGRLVLMGALLLLGLEGRTWAQSDGGAILTVSGGTFDFSGGEPLVLQGKI